MSDGFLDDDDGDDELVSMSEEEWDAMRDAERDAATDDNDEELTDEQIGAIRASIRLKLFEPRPFDIIQTKKIIAVIDTETDPFAAGLHVKPFCIGVALPDRYLDFWGDDCVEQFFAWLATETDDYIFYAHNGGKFDFFFFLKYLDAGQTPLIMNGRLVKISFQGQEFRDSYSIIPQPLSAYKKDEIDYQLFTRDKRQRHKAKILAYMKSDCIYTLELIRGFHDMFGDKLTIASASFRMLHSVHGFERITSEHQDERFRAYYYGGRVQCFERGELLPRRGRKWRVVDRNSMYPAEMRDTMHPISAACELQRTIDSRTDFALIDAYSDGCLPTRAEDGSLDFPVGRGTFYATRHEIEAGLDTKTLTIHRVRHAWAFERRATFEEYVTRFYGFRLDAKAIDDKVRDILYKYCLNSPYGKFAINPRKFKQWCMTVGDAPKPLATKERPKGWSLEVQSGDIFIWSRPSPRQRGFLNVATAASITGAARANLWRNIRQSERVIYCDTDSIVCEAFHGDIDEKRLGGWKIEAEGTRAAIAGKKLYAIFNEDDVLKKASKGVSISAAEIVDVCRGETILYENQAPTFALDGSASFIKRRVQMTGGE